MILSYQDAGFSLGVDGFKSGWGYFANCQQTLENLLNCGKKSDSICCQPWPRIFRFCHPYGNLLSTCD